MFVKIKIKAFLSIVLTLILFCAWGRIDSASASSDWKPKDNIILVTHASAGTGIDIFLRAIADIWMKNNLISERVSVENLTGAGGKKAREYISKKNKGNTHMLFGYTPSQINRPIIKKEEITPRSFTAIALMAIEPLVMVVNAESEFKSVQDVIGAARKDPKKLTQGGGPYGNVPSIVAKMLAEETGVEFSYVPFKGGGAGVVALLGKHVDFILEQPSEVDQHVKARTLRLLAASVTLDKYPGLPTFESLGYKFKPIKQFRGLMAPPGIPAEVASYYINLLDQTRKTVDWKKYVEKYDLVEQWITGEELARSLDEEADNYTRKNKEMGLLK
ncbi:MAG: tripartite tricarboxylate transporter substrate binding protein [Desulfobacterales bacterium]|nr:tripartite tricarboxylate transporter substrate binding protein [Desulfobacterales bacterium]